MKKFLLGVSVTALVLFVQSVSAQTKTNTAILKQASVEEAAKQKALIEKVQSIAKQKGWPLVMKRPHGGVAILTGIDGFGNAQYTSTENNITSAATIGTNQLWPGGSTGLNLNGSSNSVRGKLAVWDGGAVRQTHVELVGRVLQKDNPANNEDHSTHVAGTMIASGVNPFAKGMSFGQQQLIAYDFNSDNAEMLSEAPNLLISNHSYGSLSGWEFNNNRWEYYGPFGSTEDFQFGYYDARSQLWDSIAYNAPNYLIVKSAGNKRDENGPAPGQTYWRRNAGGTFISGTRPLATAPDAISNNDGYDILPTYAVAKNILTVGAVSPISAGYNRPGDVEMSSFSSWGPTDDGRIKPDVVADGVDLLSSVATSDNAYDIFSGTSMASPSAAGSLLLLQEYYNQLHAGQFMRSATLKGLIIHTADEAGPSPGPDYQFGWGLINMKKAADVIKANNTTHIIREEALTNGQTFSLPVTASGNGTIVATICWTDPKASVEPTATALDNATKKLVHDLDIKIKKGANTYLPWTLSPSVPDAAATRGDNTLDNVEKIELTDVIPGEQYTIEVTHKGTLQRNSQAFSLIVSGVGGVAYCASNPTSTAGSKIDSVSVAAIQKKNIAGCTSYNNYTTLAGGIVEAGQTIPIFVRLRSCDVVADKMVKIFIDANNDGDFTDADETLATSGVLTGDVDYSTNITIPPGLTVGKFAVLRVVLQEGTNAAAILPCGTYAKGETQDYKLQVVTPTSDAGITELISPDASNCAMNGQYVTVRITNFGVAAKSNIPVSVSIKQGTTTIANLNDIYKGTLNGGESTEYTLQTPFNSVGGATYTITSSTILANDQVPANNSITSTVTIRANSAAPVGTATICSATSNTILQATATGTDIYTWYTSAAATTPIASGANTTTTTSANPYYLGKNDVSQHLGAPNKMAFATGSYLGLTDADQQLRAIFTTQGPVTIETARMYLSSPGILRVRLAKINSFDYLTGAIDGFFVSDHFIDAYATSPTPYAAGTVVNDPADLGAIYRLGITIPEAGMWALIMGGTGTGLVYRNNTITGTNYPYSLPGIISLDGNGATNNTANYFQGFYYFWYDMAVRLGSCPAPRATIVPTTPAAPVISVTGNVMTSTVATGNQWYKDGVAIPGEVGQTYTATTDGAYTSRITVAGCTLTSNTLNFVFTAVQNVDPSQIGLIVSPVPARKQFQVQFETRTKANLDISLVNTAGQQVYHTQVPGFIGKYSESIQPAKVAAGVYYLRVVHDKKMYIRKVVIID